MRNDKRTITDRRDGFTLLELIIALAAAVAILSAAFTVYKRVVDSGERLEAAQQRLWNRMKVMQFMNSVIADERSLCFGDKDTLVLRTRLNILGKGREILRLSRVIKGKDVYFRIEIFPEVFSGDKVAVNAAKDIFAGYEDSGALKYTQEVKGVGVSFGYVMSGKLVERVEGARPETIVVTWDD